MFVDCLFQAVGGASSCSSGKGRSQEGLIKYGFSLVKGKAHHPMEDYHVAKFVRIAGHEVGLFAIYDGHLGDRVAVYLQKHLFSNILDEVFYSFHTHRFEYTHIRALCYVITLSCCVIVGRVLGRYRRIYFKSLRENRPGDSG